MSRSRALTDRQVRALVEPGEHAVGGVGGLVLRVRGEARTFRLRYRNRDGVMRNVNLGAYPSEISLAEARAKAAEIRGKVRDKRDPVAEDKADRAAPRMADLFGETDPEDKTRDAAPGWYLATYVRTAGKLGTAKTDKSIATDRYYIAKHLRSRKAFMRKRVAEVTPADLNRIKADATPGVWRNLRDILRIVFRHAEEIGAIPHGTNPALRVKASTSRKIERYLSPEERQGLDAALARAEKIGSSGKGEARGTKGGTGAHVVRAIRLLVLTGMRRGEVLALRWEQVDWHHGQLRLPTSKTGEKSVPLTSQAIAFLQREREKAAKGVEVGKVRGLVCGAPDGSPIDPSNLERAWRSIRKAAGLDGSDGQLAVRIHDLRHSWAADAASAGVPLHTIATVLGHESTQTTKRYAHLHPGALREGLELAGARIEAATAAGGDVVALHGEGQRGGKAPRADRSIP